MKNNHIIYFDSCVFLSYINQEPNRYQVVEDLLDEVEHHDDQIITSTVSIVEVAHSIHEYSNHQLDPLITHQLDDMWQDPIIALIDVNVNVANKAKGLIRYSIEQQWGKLTHKDAIHLASAQFINENINKVDNFFTYDEGLFRFGSIIGIDIKAPYVNQPSVLHSPSNENTD